MIAAGKAKPGSLNYSSAGVGSASHFGGERLRTTAGFEAQHIPFKGAAEAVTDVVADRSDFSVQLTATTLPLIRDGKLVPLAVSAHKRDSSLPDMPTTIETRVCRRNRSIRSIRASMCRQERRVRSSTSSIARSPRHWKRPRCRRGSRSSASSRCPERRINLQNSSATMWHRPLRWRRPRRSRRNKPNEKGRE